MMNPRVDFFFHKNQKWKDELEALRGIILGSGLTEELKWGVPCYTLRNANVILIHAFKEYCAVLFFKGALLKDPKGILIRQTENVQAARQVRFTRVSEIMKMRSTLKTYIRQAIEIETAGLKVNFKKTEAYTLPEEFRRQLAENPGLKKAFNALTPGRQRGYLLHFSQAKQSATRESRIKKFIPKILKGKGLND
jgi:uncharacterized protein YdeI (YjbR/CyaY-like superfamily)